MEHPVLFNHQNTQQEYPFKYRTKNTVAIQREGDHYKVGWSLCSPKDNFCKKTGREQAVKRMNQSDITVSLQELLDLIDFDGSMFLRKSIQIEKFTLADIKFSYVFNMAIDKINASTHFEL